MGHDQWKDVGLDLATAFLETEAEDGESFVTLFHLIAHCYDEFALDRKQHCRSLIMHWWSRPRQGGA